MFADIATGNTAAADVCFLVAVVLFAVAVGSGYRPSWPFAPLVAYAGLAAVALGLLLL